jgi:hypothetical protein
MVVAFFIVLFPLLGIGFAGYIGVFAWALLVWLLGFGYEFCQYSFRIFLVFFVLCLFWPLLILCFFFLAFSWFLAFRRMVGWVCFL